MLQPEHYDRIKRLGVMIHPQTWHFYNLRRNFLNNYGREYADNVASLPHDTAARDSYRRGNRLSQQRAVNALSWGHKVTMGMPAEFGYNYTTIDNPNQLQYAPKGAEFFSGAKSFVIRDPNGDLLYGQGGKPELFDTAKQANEHIDLMLLVDRQASGDTLPKLSGLDLKVGGEWARNLYDRAIPNFLKGYAKRWGAKVGPTDLSSGKTFTVEYNPAYEKEKWGVYEHGKDGSHLRGTWKSEEAAKTYLRDLQKADKTTVHSIDLTPELKRSVLQGQPIAKVEPSWQDAVNQLATA